VAAKTRTSIFSFISFGCLVLSEVNNTRILSHLFYFG
jgi:hypothetical protein